VVRPSRSVLLLIPKTPPWRCKVLGSYQGQDIIKPHPASKNTFPLSTVGVVIRA